MKHTSVKLNSPCEFINITPLNPLISKCQIKVCYVGEQPNRNRSIITKEVATQMANSLPGCPIVGFYNENRGDFEEHNRTIDISNGEFKIKDTTIPYGFVDMNAKVWFQKFLDDGKNEREYLMTEGYIWTGQFPESQRIFEDNGNNHSMELDEGTLNATWTKDDNGKPQFFIINEAVISKLCILGEDFEPCFEGSTITKVQFSFEDNFQNRLFSMMDELKELIKEGGAKQVFTKYAVEIGDSLWTALYNHIETTYPDVQNAFYSVYRIEGVFEDNDQKFAVLQSRADMKYYRLNFSLTDDSGFIPSDVLIEVTKSYVPAEEPQFSLEAVEQFETEYSQNKTEENNEAEEDKTDETIINNSENNSEEDSENKEVCPKCGKEIEQCECEKDNIENKYNLEEVVEYVELSAQHEELKTKFSTLEAEYEQLKAQLEPLVEFKKASEKKEKEAMIASFYMLSEEDKADVIANIDNYSVEDIEAKLSIICVRNKVSFNLEQQDNKDTVPTTYNLNDSEDDASTPAWIKAVLATSEKKNN